MVDSYQKIFANKKRILAVFAHPDDLELFCGGTIARLIKDGKTVRSVKVTTGDSGSRQETITSEKLKNQRLSEDEAAMKILGISPENNIYLNITDGTVDNSLDTIGKIAQQIRLFKPDLIITHNPEHSIIRFDQNNSWMNHRDHRATGQSTLDAAYPYSRDLLFFPEHFNDSNASSHSVCEYLLVDYYEHPDIVGINITDTVDIRVRAHASHSSQYSLEAAQESADFFTLTPNGRFERFRYVVTD